MIAAVERGFPQTEIANSAYHFQRQLEVKEKVMVGVNKHTMVEPKRTMATLYIDRSVEKKQCEKLVALKKKRNPEAVRKTLAAIREDAKAGKNMCPTIFAAVKEYVTLQEICDELRGVYGVYSEAGSF